MNGDDRRAGPSVGAPSIEVVSSLAEVSPDAWDRVAGDDDPFVEHAFLRALETSGSVGADSGWAPCHIIARGAGGRLVGAMPLYLKDNSYGEYIFDWSWADASHRARIPYYPKLVSAVPFTPATGRRLLVADDAGPEVSRALLAGARDLADALGASSIHVLFCTEAERLAASEWMGWLPRTTYQFHWTNAGYGSFDDFLGRFRAQSRRQVRSERRRAREGGLRLNLCRGTEMTDAEWAGSTWTRPPAKGPTATSRRGSSTRCVRSCPTVWSAPSRTTPPARWRAV